MSSVFTSLAGCTTLALEARLVSAANTVINVFGWMPTQVPKETEKTDLLEANKVEGGGGDSVQQIIGVS